MGAGKTTFIRELCEYLGTLDDVSSPTFALISEYRIFPSGQPETSVFHMDLYRINSFGEAVNAGVEDCIQQALADNAYVFAEWPERAPELFRAPHIALHITTIDELTRTVTVQYC